MMSKVKQYKNRVELAGRVSGEPTEKTLPSGDVVAEFRLIIDRDDREGVDTLDVAAWKANLRKRALSLEAEEWIGIKGVLRRRFWKGSTGTASRWQVEAREIERI
ncbi:MAG: single-stranded DNA-binding protein [Candidatus Nanopelagicaceae bacterium]|nr:single-stranded DNA-binding protein [Candidatus Nanopelagicaceae bacterium]